MAFVHETLGQRVVFAYGRAAETAASELAALGVSKAMLIASEHETTLADPIAAAIPVALRHTEVVMHVPVDVAGRARDAASAAAVDVVVTVGGGSATGLGKAVALAIGLPIVAVPTTYAGSEATNVWGLTDGDAKTTGVDARVLPRSVVYDASLLASLPTELAVASGLNATAHCVDAMWGPRADPIDLALAQEGIRSLAAGLPVVAASSGETAPVEAIEQALYGAYLGAVSFSSAGSGMHHKMCHVLAGMLNLPHAETHAVVLPHVLAFNAPNAPEAERRIATAFGTACATEGLAQLRKTLDAPKALKDYGMREDAVATAVGPILASVPANNPTPVTAENLTALLRRAWSGEEPG